MPRKVFFLLVILSAFHGFAGSLIAQQTKPVATLISRYHQHHISFKKTAIFKPSPISSRKAEEALSSFSQVRVDRDEIATLISAGEEAVELSFPFKGKLITVDLARVNLFSDDFRLVTDQSNGASVTYQAATCYRGIVKGDQSSLAAFSFFQDELSGIISTNEYGNIVIGKLRVSESEDEDYIIYSDRDFISVPVALCGTFDDPSYIEKLYRSIQRGSALRTTNCVRFYYELDYDIYEECGDEISSVFNWIAAVHNNVATLFSNDMVTTAISELFIWTTPDPYNKLSAIDQLNTFKIHRPWFNGDLGQLLSIEPGSLGGIASNINGFCSLSDRYSYSDIDHTYGTVPVYSWTVNAIAHEFGHLMGSYHTHNCFWPGGAIDNCGPLAGFPNEGQCPLGPEPSDGGTIMSYCHLTTFGINFNNGFGELPGDAIRGAIDESLCMTSSCEPNPPAYCPSEGKTVGEWIESVAFNDFKNASGAGAGYSDFTSAVANLQAGSKVTFKLTPGYSGTNWVEYFNIWIDLNLDFDFTDAGENVYQSSGTTTAVTGNFVVPGGVTGSTRMRVSMKFDTLPGSCEFYKYGEVEDYTVSFDPPVPYCISKGDNATKEWIDYVQLGTLERSSDSDSGYYDGTHLSGILALNSTNTLTYSGEFTGGSFTEYWKAWIDYNANGDFSDPGEKILTRHSQKKGLLTKTFTIPTTATIGKTRMRVSMKRNSGQNACETFVHGEVEDYSILIVPPLVAAQQIFAFTPHLYPNPASIEITVAIPGGFFSGYAEILDLSGRTLKTSSFAENATTTQFIISDLPAGFYFVRIVSADNYMKLQKWMKW